MTELQKIQNVLEDNALYLALAFIIIGVVYSSVVNTHVPKSIKNISKIPTKIKAKFNKNQGNS